MAGGEASGLLEDPHDLGGIDQHLSRSLADPVRVGAQDLHMVTRTQSLQHVAGIDVDGKLDHAGLLARGNQAIRRNQHVLSQRCGEHLAGDGRAIVRPEIASKLGRRQSDLDEREIVVRERHARGEVTGRRVDRDEVLGPLEHDRAREHGAEDEHESEHRAQVDPARGLEPGCRWRGGGGHGGRI